MIGWPLAWKCLVAWRLGESSQQPTWPQVRQSRKCSHTAPILRQSSHPLALGSTSRIASPCVHADAASLRCVIGPTILLEPAPPHGASRPAASNPASLPTRSPLLADAPA